MKYITKEGSVSCGGFPWWGPTPICHRICQSVDYNITHCSGVHFWRAVQYVSMFTASRTCGGNYRHAAAKPPYSIASTLKHCNTALHWKVQHCIYVETLQYSIALEPPYSIASMSRTTRHCTGKYSIASTLRSTRHCTRTTIQRCIYVKALRCIALETVQNIAQWKPLLCFALHYFPVQCIACQGTL